MPCTERRIPPPLETEKKKGGSEHGGQSYDWRDEIGARQEVENEPSYVSIFSMNFSQKFRNRQKKKRKGKKNQKINLIRIRLMDGEKLLNILAKARNKISARN